MRDLLDSIRRYAQAQEACRADGGDSCGAGDAVLLALGEVREAAAAELALPDDLPDVVDGATLMAVHLLTDVWGVGVRR